MGLGIGDERADVGRRDRVRQREPVVIFGNQGDRRQIAELEAWIFVGGEVDRLEMCAQQKRVAVGRTRDHVTRGDNATRGRLILTRWPSASLSLSAMNLAGISVGPPTPKPTTSLIGRSG